MSTQYHVYAMTRKTTYIYGLIDPRTSAVRYVGKSDNPDRRLKKHISACHKKKSHSATWIRSLLEIGLAPSVAVLEEVWGEDWEFAEREWIANLRRNGCDLTNIREGGGWHEATPEARAKLSESKKGKPVPWLNTPEVHAKANATRTGKKRAPCSAQRREKIRSLWASGKYRREFTEEHRRRISESKTGKPRPKEVIRKMREGLKAWAESNAAQVPAIGCDAN